MNLSSVKKGPFTLYTVETGRFKLDGGAMFGVIPKPMWEKQIPADDQNRISMAMRCLLVHSEETGRLYLIDNGSGTKFNEKLSKIYDFTYPYGNLEDSLKQHGFSPDDITDVVFSHLHFDHCGGTTRYNDSGEAELVFTNANFWVTAEHWATASNPNPRERASFLPENLEPMRRSKRMKFSKEGFSFEPGLSVVTVNGHTTGQQLPIIETGDFRMVFAADLIPTAAHVPLPWVMGYDMRAVDTLNEKKKLLEKWQAGNYLLYLEHDASHEVITLKKGKKYVEPGDSLKLSDL